LTFDLLTSGSVQAEVMRRTICLPTLVLIAQAVFLLEYVQTSRQTNRQTDRQTRLNALPHADVYTAGVYNKNSNIRIYNAQNVDGISYIRLEQVLVVSSTGDMARCQGSPTADVQYSE